MTIPNQCPAADRKGHRCSLLIEHEGNCDFTGRPMELVPLTTKQLMNVGAMIPEMDRQANMKQYLESQRAGYKQFSKDTLIDELVRRDENAMKLGHEASDGRLQARFLREVLRTVLYTADHGTLRNALGDRSGKTLDNDSKAGTVENLLRALGADPADNQALRLHGSTLGSLDTRSPEEAVADPLVPTQGQSGVGDQIRKFRDEKTARQVNETRRDEPKTFTSPTYPEPKADEQKGPGPHDSKPDRTAGQSEPGN